MDMISQYQQSIAAEFQAQKDRVRFFIGDAHWGEDGRYKEILLADFLKTILPNNVAVGTGFVRNSNNDLTNQIDIIIYQQNCPTLFKKGDFVVLMPESVLGIIEVKSTTSSNVLTKRKSPTIKSVIETCENNGIIIGNKQIFNGLWGYESTVKVKPHMIETKIGTQLSQCDGYLNHICFDSNIFCRYWNTEDSPTNVGINAPYFRFYNLSWSNVFCEKDSMQPGLAFGYFISNLLECVYKRIAPEVLNKQYFEFLYPLENTKEAYRCSGCDIKCQSVGDYE